MLDGGMCWRRCHLGAGEFNGFLKIREPLLQPALRFDNGQLYISAGYQPKIDWEAQTVVQKRTFS
jgi:hypothetical protein